MILQFATCQSSNLADFLSKSDMISSQQSVDIRQRRIYPKRDVDYELVTKESRDAEPEEPQSTCQIENHSAAYKKLKQYGLLIDIMIPFALFLCSFGINTWNIGHPRTINIPEEITMGKIINYYLKGQFFFDGQPPLGNLIMAYLAQAIGYNGKKFDFESNLNITLRTFVALFGSFVTPIAYLTLKEMKCQWSTALAAATAIMLNPAFVVHSRLVGTNSLQLLSSVVLIYSWIRFRQIRYRQFSWKWWKWMTFTALALANSMSMTFTGYYMCVFIWICVSIDLWEIIDIRRKFSNLDCIKHCLYRIVFLFILPVTFYIGLFYIHLSILKKGGSSSDEYMSRKFQGTLQGSRISTNAQAIPYGAIVTIRHAETFKHLLSHSGTYPPSYPDGRKSSQGQQVLVYSHENPAVFWKVMLPNSSLSRTEMPRHNLSVFEKENNIRFIRPGDPIVLYHEGTDSFLYTQPDIMSPTDADCLEITTVGKTTLTKEYYDRITWRVYPADASTRPGLLMSWLHEVRISHPLLRVALSSDPKEKLPEWGNHLQAVKGNYNQARATTKWFFDKVQHSALIDARSHRNESEFAMSFTEKLAELHGVTYHRMIKSFQRFNSLETLFLVWKNDLGEIPIWRDDKDGRKVLVSQNEFLRGLYFIGPIAFIISWFLTRILRKLPRLRYLYDSDKIITRSVGFFTLGWLLSSFINIVNPLSYSQADQNSSLYLQLLATSVFFDLVCKGIFVPQDSNARKNTFAHQAVSVIYRTSLIIVTYLNISHFTSTAYLTYGFAHT